MKKIMVLVLTFFAMCAFADVSLTEKTDDTVSSSFFSKDRIAVYENGQLVNITDLKSQTIYGFNAVGKTYFKASFKEMSESYAGGDTGMEMPKQQVVIKKTGVGEYGGFACDRYELSVPGTKTVSQICVSPQIRQLLLKEMNTAALKNWLKIMDFEGDASPLRAKLTEISDKIGYIVYEKTVESISGVPSNMATNDAYVTELQSVSTKPIDGGKFSIPAGYKKVSMQEALGGDE